MRAIKGVEVSFSASCGLCYRELDHDGDNFNCEDCKISYSSSGSECWANEYEEDDLVCGHPADRVTDTRPMAEIPEGATLERPQYLIKHHSYMSGPRDAPVERTCWLMWRYVACPLPLGHKGDHHDPSGWISDREYESEWGNAHHEDGWRSKRAKH